MCCRDVDLTEKLDYSSAVVLLGYSLILAILRTFSIRDEATRVMVAAPLIAFVTTHVMYINFYLLDYGKSCHVIFILLLPRLRVDCRNNVLFISLLDEKLTLRCLLIMYVIHLCGFFFNHKIIDKILNLSFFFQVTLSA